MDRSSDHVAFLSWRDPWHPEAGGSERWLQQVAERMAAGGDRVTVVTARYGASVPREVRNGVRYVRRGGRLSVYLWAAWLLLTKQLGRVTSVVEVQNGMPFLARLFTEARVVVLVHHVHREQWPVVGPVLAKVGWLMESRVAVRVNRGLRYLAVSDVTRAELVQLGVDPQAISLAWNGTDPVPELPGLEQTRQPSLVVLGRLVPHKRVEHAVAATAALRDDFPGLTLRVVGSGWWEQELRQETKRRGVDDVVTLVGHVSETEKYRELGRAWIHLLPSLKEGWGLSIIEAAQVGVPSVAYADAGGVRDSILDGTTGLLAHDEADFIDAVRRLLADDELRRDLGHKAQLRTAEFTWEATTAAVRRALSN
ncbi:glycosyltransferase family 4 protein [Nocardioides alcanivorans]|uniref:glycosyltransferase family 4 protein n=1 Tax=Nocardioides alcanivorans TaxID=2897352 RepID=UPI001F44EDBD|nr:glycosyltransferase family 4 protein [Nocardioides alcanivorans]